MTDTGNRITLAGQAAVVTGAGSGIGRAIALSLASNDATVYLVGRRLSALQKVAAEAGAERCRCYQADLAQPEEVHRLGADLSRDCQRIDILVHNAGTIALGDLSAQSAEDFDRQYFVNVRAPYVLTQELLPKLRSSCGQIVFVNSTAALRAGPKSGQYAASKAALRALADSLRDEVNHDGVRVLSALVGRTATPMQAAVHQFETKQYRPELLMQPEDVASMILSALALARTAEVTELVVRPMRK
jgi:short-subunit dehydrogenase